MTLADLLKVAEDKAREEGEEVIAEHLRALRIIWNRPIKSLLGLSTEEVLIRCGYDPDFLPGPGARRSGRTIRMLAQAVSVMTGGVLPRLVGHSADYTDQLYHDFFVMARQCGLEREFVDHFALERGREAGRRRGTHHDRRDR